MHRPLGAVGSTCTRYPGSNFPPTLTVSPLGCRPHGSPFRCPLLLRSMAAPIPVTDGILMTSAPDKKPEGPWKKTAYKEKVQQIAVWLRTYSWKWCSSSQSIAWFTKWFSIPSHLLATTALGSRCDYSHFTAEKGGIKAFLWTCMARVRSREGPTLGPPHNCCTSARVTATWCKVECWWNNTAYPAFRLGWE